MEEKRKKLEEEENNKREEINFPFSLLFLFISLSGFYKTINSDPDPHWGQVILPKFHNFDA
jgi:hypothetical protein